jgi:hypothetical protein
MASRTLEQDVAYLEALVRTAAPLPEGRRVAQKPAQRRIHAANLAALAADTR